MIYLYLTKIPVFGNVLRIFNSYAYQGDEKADYQFASLTLWFKTFWAPVFFSITLTCLSSENIHNWINPYISCHFELPRVDSNISPTDLIISILPNLLGFGIGVYALIFALSNTLVTGLQDFLKKSISEGNRKSGSVLMLNSDLAYPLLILVLAISYGVIAKLFAANTYFVNIAWFVFWFSMITILELVTSLFSLGENELLIKLDSKKPDKTDQENKT